MSAHELDGDSTCHDCLFVDYSDGFYFDSESKPRQLGICRRNPPTTSDDSGTRWPFVKPLVDFCGEFINCNPALRATGDRGEVA